MHFIKPDIMPIYKNEVYKQRQKNIYTVLNDKGIEKKVKNFAERWGYSETFIWDQLNTNELFALFFAKDPAKQGIHQQIACNYISTFPFVYKMEQLPTSDEEKTLFCVNGQAVKRKDLVDPKGVKSIDFHWKYEFKNKELNFYASHKFTNEEGGAQDNQFNDIMAFNKEAMKCTDKNIYFYSITDGEYYLHIYKKDKSFNGTKLEYLKEKYTSKRNGATNTNNLLPDMLLVIKSWLISNFNYLEIKDELNKIEYILNFYTLED